MSKGSKLALLMDVSERLYWKMEKLLFQAKNNRSDKSIWERIHRLRKVQLRLSAKMAALMV